MGAKVSKTEFLSPGMAVSMVWGRTNLLSGEQDVHTVGAEYTTQLKDLKKSAQNQPDELRYIEEASAYMDAAFRNVVTIIRGRDINFKEAEKLHDNHQKIIDQYENFSLDLQSTIPRLSGMAIGGVSVAAILNQVMPVFIKNTFGEFALPALLAAGAALGYVVYGGWVLPYTKRMREDEMKKIDYSRNLYYDQYINRTKKALSGLYDRMNDLHNTIFNQKYDDVSGQVFVDSLFGGMNSTMCSFVHECIPKGLAPSDRWSACETGVNLEGCDIRRSKLNQ